MVPFDTSIRRELRLIRPRTPRQLHAYVRAVLGFRVPRQPIVIGHQSPFEYLSHAFFEERTPRDCVVWANRGGGKTQLGAVATLLDILFKPGIQVRILAGSFDQSSKMYRYLKRLLEDDAFNDLIAGNLTGRYVELKNGSRVEVLAQSERAVRGQRVHKLRCDEVELFTHEVWDAAQMVTRSGWCGDIYVPGAIESLSTMHRQFGLMQRMVGNASGSRRIFRWNVLDVLERCPPERPCEPCELWRDCGGRAKDAGGFIAIDDAVQQKERVDPGVWAAEMLCESPSRSDCVYPEFDRDTHVCEFDVHDLRHGLPIGGMDFGYRESNVLLWAIVHDGVVHIIDELVLKEHITERIIAAAGARPWPRPSWIGADPAGHQRSEQSGVSAITLWKRAGWPIRTRSLTIEAGLKAVRLRLMSAAGRVSMRIHPRCCRLIESLAMYRYPPNKPDAATPMKDGHDHACDALRYMIVNLDCGGAGVKVRGY